MVDFGLLFGETAQAVGSGVTDVAKMNIEDKKKQAEETRAEAREWARLRAVQEFQAGESELSREFQSKQAELLHQRQREAAKENSELRMGEATHQYGLAKDDRDREFELRQSELEMRRRVQERAAAAAERAAGTDEEKRRFDAWKELNDSVTNHYKGIEELDKQIAQFVGDEAGLQDLKNKRAERVQELVRTERMAEKAAPEYIRKLQAEEGERFVMESFGLELDQIQQIRRGYNNEGIQAIVAAAGRGDRDALSIYASSKYLNEDLHKQLSYQIEPLIENRKAAEKKAGTPTFSMQQEKGRSTTSGVFEEPAQPVQQGLMTPSPFTDTVPIPEEQRTRGLFDRTPATSVAATPDIAEPEVPEVPEVEETPTERTTVTAPSRGTQTNEAAQVIDSIVQDLPSKVKGAIKSVQEFFRNPDDMQAAIQRYKREQQAVGDAATKRFLQKKIDALQKKINEIVQE